MSKILLIYDEIGYWGTTSKDVAQFLIDNKGEDIEVHVNSPGGEVFEAYAIYNNLKNTSNCTIYVDGIAASAAAIIALCGKPLKMASASQLMLHSASCGAYGNKKELEEQIEFLNSIDTTLATMIAGKLGKDVEEIKNTYFDGKDHWLSASECAEMGICELWEPSTEDRMRRQKATACLRYQYNNHKNSIDDMLKKIQSVSAFTQCATEDEAMASINKMVADNAKLVARVAELENAEKELKEFKDKLAKAQADADKEFIDNAVKDGRISGEMKPVYEAMMATDRENTHKVIDSLVKKAPNKVDDFIGTKDGKGEMPNTAWDKMIEGYAKNLNK